MVLTIRLSPAQRDALDRAAIKAMVTPSEIVRRLIDQGCSTAEQIPVDRDQARAKRLIALRSYALKTRGDALDTQRKEHARQHRGGHEAHLRPPAPVRPKALRFQLGLDVNEVIEIEEHAALLAMTPARFCTLLVRRWLGLRRPLPPATSNALVAIRREIRRIGININQWARSANQLTDYDRVARYPAEMVTVRDLADATAELPALIQEIIGLTADIDAQLGTERAYWSIATSDNEEVLPHPALHFVNPDGEDA